jgi:hypothetical protein
MEVILSFMAIGAFFFIAAIIETMLGGRAPSESTFKNNKRLNNRRR